MGHDFIFVTGVLFLVLALGSIESRLEEIRDILGKR